MADIKNVVADTTTPPVAPATVVDLEAGKMSKQEPVYALHKINGAIEPGTIFRPATADMTKELNDLSAVRELTDAEAALFAQVEAGADSLG